MLTLLLKATHLPADTKSIKHCQKQRKWISTISAESTPTS